MGAMRLVFVLPLLLTLFACADSADHPFDAVVTFAVAGSGGASATISDQASVFLSAQKPGRKTIVDAWQDGAGEGEQYGRHEFPRGCSASAIAGYFDGLLRNAGWTNADYRVDGASLSLFGVREVASGADRKEIVVAVVRNERKG